jgi:hypothetical protein
MLQQNKGVAALLQSLDVKITLFHLSKKSNSIKRQWMIKYSSTEYELGRHRNSCSCILHIWNYELHI